MSREVMRPSFLGVSVNVPVTPFSPVFSYIPYKAPWQYFKFPLAFSRSPSAIVSTVALSCPQHQCNKKHSVSHTLTMLPAALQPCSGVAAVREQAACFGFGQTGARADGWRGHGVVPAPRLATASLRDRWLLLPFPLSSDGVSPLCLSSAFHSALENVIIFETISSCQV